MIWLADKKPFDIDDPKSFVELVKTYAESLAGKIEAYSDSGQYVISNDPLKLIFQCDDLFGMTIVVPKETGLETARKAIEILCCKIDEK